MKMKVFYLLTLIILILGCWFSAILFGGILNPGTLIALVLEILVVFSNREDPKGLADIKSVLSEVPVSKGTKHVMD